MQKRKILIIGQEDILNTTGGTIKVFFDFCNMLYSNNFNIEGIFYSKFEASIITKYKVVNLYSYYDGKKSYSDALNQYIEEKVPQLIIFFFPYLYVNARLNKKFDSIKRVLMFHSRPDFYFASDKKVSNKLQKYYINTTSQILFPEYKNLLPEFIKNTNVIYIPNASEKRDEVINTDIEHRKIIYLSRIDCRKGQDFLIKSFSLISKKYSDWTIDIYGQSQPPNYMAKLNSLVKELKLENQILFKGITTNVYKTFLDYDFCVFPSYFEGTPLGLLEAQSMGLPAIGFKGCTGVSNLIEDNINGFLTEENYDEFARKIETLILDSNLRKSMSKEAILSSQKYDKSLIYPMWKDFINDLLDDKPVKLLTKNVTFKYKPFSIKKIVNLSKEKYSFKDIIFSVKNDYCCSTPRKIYCILGIKFKVRIRYGTKAGINSFTDI